MNQNYELINHFFNEKGLVHQHIDSYNYFIEHELTNIMKANNLVDSDIDPSFFLKYTKIHVGRPTICQNMIEKPIYPQECRNCDLSYSASIFVSVEYTLNRQVVQKENLFLAKMPVMLRSKICHLTMNEDSKIQSSATRGRRASDLKECVYDNGGYFIINGCERVLMIQEQLAQNRIILENGKKGFCATVTSSSIKHKGKTSVYVKNGCFYVQNTLFSEDVPAVIVARACGVGSDRAVCEIVGGELYEHVGASFEDVVRNNIYTEEQALMYLAGKVKLRQNENKLLGVRALLHEKFLPNLNSENGLCVYEENNDENKKRSHDKKTDNSGCLKNNSTSDFSVNSTLGFTSASLRTKGVFVCLMIRRIALAQCGKISVDDKDFVGNKRFELAGQLLGILFEDSFKKFNFELKKAIDKILHKRTRTSELDALTYFNLHTSTITMALNRAISSGNWNLKRFRMERSGVSSIVTRYSYMCALGMMTKINSHFEKTRKISGPRALHTSSWGVMCPADTPEGESCGLVKNLALLTEITTEWSAEQTRMILWKLGTRIIDECYGSEFYQPGNYLVFINGGIFGVTGRPHQLVKAFRIRRRRGEIGRFVSICLNDDLKTVSVATDNGRMCRPLIIVDEDLRKKYFKENKTDGQVNDKQIIKTSKTLDDIRKKLRLNFEREEMRYKSFYDFIDEGRIEYLDVHEENNCRIAFRAEDVTEETTHLEIAEFSILSYVAGLVPFPDHNQSPRNTYQCAMGKQAIGHIATNVKKRFDNMILQLNYTQRPMAASKTLDITKYNSIPAGINAMVAVMSYSGYDIEDALILNKGAIDRGMARVEVYRTTTVNLKKQVDGQSEILIHNANNNGNSLRDGIISPGNAVSENTILVNKMSPTTNTLTNVKYHGLNARVDKVMLTKSESGNIIKIVTRETRSPEIGDKFSSRHGQKGVVGLVVPQEDMPFNDYGLSPDIIMNPHGYPSRMTVGKLIEAVSSKAGLIEGSFVDATPFNGRQNVDHLETVKLSNDVPSEVRSACDTLVSNGFSYSGKDIFYSGTTGEPLEAYVFYGPIFYQRLKHMVADKMHCRARGPRAILTRQPTEGRARDGGLRLGEMERDCLIGYGASGLLNERLMISSDACVAYVCNECGVIAYKNKCRICRKATPVPIKLPYACKLLFQELMSMNILPRISLDG